MIFVWAFFHVAVLCGVQMSRAGSLSAPNFQSVPSAEQLRLRALDESTGPQSTRWSVRSSGGPGFFVYFSGMTLPGDCQKFQKLAFPDFSTLVVNSGGGDAFEGLCIGNEMIRRKMNVEVVGFCMSSCANYLFTAGTDKKINGGVVGFHGGISALSAEQTQAPLAYQKNLMTQGISAQNAQASWLMFRKKLETQALEERKFFRRLGISPKLFEQTQRRDKGVGAGSAYDFLLPKPATFKKYGIRGVKGEQNLALSEAAGLRCVLW